MQPPIQLDSSLELRDSTGTLGYFVPEQVIKDLIFERDRLRREITDLQKQLDSLQQERDVYRMSVMEMTRIDDVVWDENDIKEMKAPAADLSDIIAELEQIEGLKEG